MKVVLFQLLSPLFSQASSLLQLFRFSWVLFPSLIVGMLFATVVYCPTSYWTWNANRWLYKLGSDDLAGDGPVHVSSGVASLVHSNYLGKRIECKKGSMFPDAKPYNPILNFIGALLIHYPWLLFNSGTPGIIQNGRALYIMANTQLASAFAVVTFIGVDYYFKPKWSLKSITEGLIVGLVFVTPDRGFLDPWAIAIGSIVTAAVCRLTYDIAQLMGVDDTTHTFNVHGIGGIVASLLVSVFCSPTIAGYDGFTEIEGSWVFQHWVQMGYQLAGTVAITAWTAVFTYAICFIVDHIPGCKLRISEEEELKGLHMLETEECKDLESSMSLAEMGGQFSEVEYLQADEASDSAGSQPQGSYELQDVEQPQPN